MNISYEKYVYFSPEVHSDYMKNVIWCDNAEVAEKY